MGKKYFWVWLKCDDSRGEAVALRMVKQLRQNSLVPKVNAVKVADGERGGRMG